MKFPAGIAVVAAASLTSLCLASPAPRSSAIGATSRSTDSLTLLPGPELLSPARGAPQSSNSVGIAPAGAKPNIGYFTFVPGRRGEAPPVAAGWSIRPGPARPGEAKGPRPPASALRFENTLQRTSTELPVSVRKL